MEKITDIFDRFNNTIGNHIDGKATDQDLIKMAYEIDKYLLQHPHPHDLVKNHGVLHDVIPYLGTARLIKNNKGHSSIKNVTLGNSYQIIEKLDRSRLRKYNPKMNDGFWIINDLGKKVSFTNENLWDVSWV